MGLLEGFFSLGANQNKTGSEEDQEQAEGVVSSLLPELEAEGLKDEELLDLTQTWQKKWDAFNGTLSQKQKDVEEYYLGTAQGGYENGKLADSVKKRPWADNLLFEALETFLPNAASRNPEPVVFADNTTEGQRLSDLIRKMLMFQADRLVVKLKLKRMLRYWALYYVGVIKVGWSGKENDIAAYTLRPQKLILDPDATIDELGVYQGEYLGEYRKDTAENLTVRFPSKKKFITSLVHGEMGTSVQYIEWWKDEYLFWTLKKEVLGKMKNPHWNYETEQDGLDEFGMPEKKKIAGVNHFSHPQMPYIFLSVFNVGKHPVDDTSLMEQNLSNQELICKRGKQIDRNADDTNGGIAVSGDFFTKEQASQAADAVRKGNAIFVPTGNVNAAVQRMSAPPLPNFIYQSLLDYRNELRSIFGTRVLSNQAPRETTARGKILSRTNELDRIGGGISEHLEQVADRLFNWFLQLMYVYYDDEHRASILGQEKAAEYVVLNRSQLIGAGSRKFIVSVQSGSMIPRDSLTRRNEAVDLWSAGAIDPITLFERLDFPNPREAAEKLILWKTNPVMYLQGGQQAAQPQIQQGAQVEQPQSQDVLNQVPIR